MARELKLLCVHGVGHGDADTQLKPAWERAIRGGLGQWDGDLATRATLDYFEYDDLFEQAPNNPLTWAGALASLLASEVVHGVGDLFHRERAFGGIPAQLRWTAGMVAQWVGEEALRAALRQRLAKQLRAGGYDGVLAHSLGSLLCYDTLIHDSRLLDGKTFVSLGSQIGNPAVRDAFGGYLTALGPNRRWVHLYNPHDHVMTAPIRLGDDSRVAVTTEFDIPNDPLNHDAAWYLGHASTVATVWCDLAGGGVATARSRHLARAFSAVKKPAPRKALLIGINDYPDPADRLNGCVNDVFLMSSVLQESGFDASEIRVVLDDRATAGNIMDRLQWLLEDARDGQQRVLFYSGHGAQLPAYGIGDEVDRLDECLVPWDFDWSPERAVTDDSFHELYSQLPYEARFVAIFDCCHSGGMTREGARRARGLTPPDDIRHRALKWNAALQMWEERQFPSLNPSMADGPDGKDYLGINGATRRLGRATSLRGLPNARYDALRKTLKHHGPYLPVILEACQEGQLSYEYRHGTQSYGAFTYSLAAALRSGKAATPPSFSRLVAQAGKRLKQLKYEQTPCLVGPKILLDKPLPWGGSRSRR